MVPLIQSVDASYNKMFLSFIEGETLHESDNVGSINYLKKAQVKSKIVSCEYSEKDIFFAFLTENKLVKNSFKQYCETVIKSLDYR